MKSLLARIPAVYFIFLGACLMGAGWVPILRTMLSLQQETLSLATIITIITIWIAGLMSGLTGMILIARKEAHTKIKKDNNLQNENKIAGLCHLAGLLFYVGIPFANYLVCFLLWQRYRQHSSFVEQHGIQAVNFQITHALYLLLSLFLTFAFGFGIILAGLLSIFHILVTIVATIAALQTKPFSYPANIKIIN